MKRINLSLDDQESLNLETMKAKYGGTDQVFIRRLLTNAFEKEFGGYRTPSSMKPKPIKEEDVELTDEQFCEMQGGEIIRKNGVPTCFFAGKGGDMDWSCDLDLIKERIKFK